MIIIALSVLFSALPSLGRFQLRILDKPSKVNSVLSLLSLYLIVRSHKGAEIFR